MANIFISHSSRNNDRAVEVKNWLVANGWDDIFLDLDPVRGIAAGQRWKEALQKAAHRCEVVLALVSPEWLASSWCKSEVDAARMIGKKIIVVLIGVDKSLVPPDLSDEQWVDLVNDPAAYTRLREGLKRAGLDPSSFALEPGRRPYPGFAFLEEKDAALFFGRDAQIVRGLDRIRRLARNGVERMLVILGASGSGKSSFLRAGLWPRLKRDDRNWLPLQPIRPERAAISGKFGLAQALLQTMTLPQFAERIRRLGLPRSRADIQEFIEKNDDGLLRIFAALRDIAQVPSLTGEAIPPPTIVLAIDQGEELFNEEGRDEAGRFIAMLTRTLKDDPHVLALVAMRSDAFPQLQSEPSTANLVDSFTLDMMLAGSYRAVIEGPARLVAPKPLKIDPQLIDALLEDVSGQDALPLLAFTLAHLYEHYAADNELSLSGYEKLGRLKGFIDTTVEEVFSEGVAEGELPRDPKAQLALARAAFIPHLARVNAAGQFVRRVAIRDEIPDEARPLIDRFAESRLLIRDRRKIAGKDCEIIEVAHEALLRQPPFSEWLLEDRDFLIWLERLSQARAAFEADERGLLTGRELQLARDWEQRRAKKDIAPPDRKFIEDSIAEDDKRRADEEERERTREATAREARQARRLRIAFIAVGVLAAIAVVGWGFAFWQSELVKQDANVRQIRYLANQSSQQTAQGDAATGLLLALEALPDQNSEDPAVRARPLLPEAAASLEQAQRAMLERKVLSGHHGPINAVAAVPGGNRIVSASDDGTARIWDIESGADLGSLIAADGAPVTTLALMTDPIRIVTGSANGNVRIWDAETHAEITSFAGGSAITALAVVSGPRRIIGFTKGKRGYIWDAQTRDEKTFNSPEVVNAVAVTSDGSRFITGSTNEKRPRIWDIEALKNWVLEGHDGTITAVAVIRDSNRIVTGSKDRTIRIWDADTRESLDSMEHLAPVTSVTVAPDGRRIISSTSDGTVYIWDAETGTRLRQIGGHRSSINAVAVASDSNRIITGSNDWTTRIWDLRPGTELVQFAGHSDGVTAVAAAPGGVRLVTVSADRTARIWDTKTGLQQRSLRHAGAVTSVAVTPGGTRFVTGSKDGTARVWDVKTGRWQGIPHPNSTTGVPYAITAVAVTRDGTRIVTGSEDKVARVWDAEQPGNAIEIKGHTDAITAVAVMGDGRIVTGSADRTVRIWKPTATSYEEVGLLRGHQSAVTAVAVLDDNRVVTGSLDKTVRVWDVRTSRGITPPIRHPQPVTAVAIAPDGSVIITGSRDGTVRIWHGETYQELAQIKAHESVTALAVVSTAEGPRIITGSSDNTARLWSLLPTGQALIDYARMSVARCLSPAQRKSYNLPGTQPRWCGSGEKYPYDSRSALIEGWRLLLEDELSEARALFTEALARNPESVVNQAWASAYIDRGLDYLKTQEDGNAKAMFAAALERDPYASGRIDAAWVDSYVSRGRNMLDAGKVSDAMTNFAEAMKRDPSANSRVEHEWAAAYVAGGHDSLKLGKVDDAKRAFDEALKHDPSVALQVSAAWECAYVGLGLKRVLDKKYEEADAAFAEALRHSPSGETRIKNRWADAYISRGRALLLGSNGEEAKAFFARALQHDPSATARIDIESAKAFIERGRISLSQGNDEAANVAFEEALRLDASAEARIKVEWTNAYIERVSKQVEQSNDEEAKIWFAKAKESDPSAARRVEAAWAEGCIRRGVALINADKYDDAMTSFSVASLHDPSARKRADVALVNAYIDRGKNLIGAGKDDEADAIYGKALARNPSVKKRIAEDQISTAIDRGQKLVENGQEEAADGTFERALKRNPDESKRINDAWAIAYNERAWKAFVELTKNESVSNPVKAEHLLRLAQKAIDRAPENAFILDTRGAIYHAMGRIDEALVDFDKAIKNGITAPSTYFERGRCHEQKGNIELAVADYQKAADLPADADYSRWAQAEAQKRLAELRSGTKSPNPQVGGAAAQ